MYRIDKDAKKITKVSNNLVYSRQIKNPRDVIKYRILAARCLIALSEDEGFQIYHLVPLDQHLMAMEYKSLLNGKTFSDVNFYKVYFSNVFQRLYPYYPELRAYDHLLMDRSRSFVKLYSEFDKFFKTRIGKEPLYVGMAVSLELRIPHIIRFLSLKTIKEIFTNPIFNSVPTETPLREKETESVINASLDQQPNYEMDLNSIYNLIYQTQTQHQVLINQLTGFIENLDSRLIKLERNLPCKKYEKVE